MSHIARLSLPRKAGYFTIAGWLTVKGRRVVGFGNYRAENVQGIIEGTARNRRMPIAEVHAALIWFATTRGYVDLVTCDRVIDEWRRARRAARAPSPSS